MWGFRVVFIKVYGWSSCSWLNSYLMVQAVNSGKVCDTWVWFTIYWGT